jgi:hypothetical protein
MRKRPLLWLTATGLAGFLVLVLLWPPPPRPGAGVTRENFDRICVGMTEAELTGVFGCPAGDYSRHGWTVGGHGVRRWWVTDEAIVTIVLEADDERSSGDLLRVRSMEFRPLPPETLRERCGWLVWDLRRRLALW